MSNHVNSRIVDVLKLSVLCLYANFSHFYFGSFCLTIFVCLSVHWKSKKKQNCLIIALWKCEYCSIWALNYSVLFFSNSLKVSVLCDMNSEKSFYNSLIWKELSENASIA